MKKTLMLLPLALMALTACGGNTSGTSDASKASDTSEAQPSTALSFIQNNYGRLDIMNAGLGITFSYGNTVEVKTENTGAYYFGFAKDTKLTVSGTLNAESVNFVVVTEKGSTTSCMVYNAILKDNLSEYFKDFTETNLAGVNKAYIAVSTGDVNWNKNESPLMNETIQRFLNVK